MPIWAWALIVLLILNVMILLGVVALRNDDVIATMSTAEPDTVAPQPTTESPRHSVAAETVPQQSGPARPELGQRSSNVSFASTPSRDNLLAQGTMVPAANLTLHVFDGQRNLRFILLDGERLGEGDVGRNGLKVNAITAEGVIFGFGSHTFRVSIQ